MASAASVKTLVSVKAFKSAPSLGYLGMRRRDSLISLRRHYPDQVQRVGSGPPGPSALSASRLPGRLSPQSTAPPPPSPPRPSPRPAAPRLCLPLVCRSTALHATPRLPQQPDRRRRIRDAPVPDHPERLPEGPPHHPAQLRWLRP